MDCYVPCNDGWRYSGGESAGAASPPRTRTEYQTCWQPTYILYIQQSPYLYMYCIFYYTVCAAGSIQL
jgi:hypothetical protein